MANQTVDEILARKGLTRETLKKKLANISMPQSGVSIGGKQLEVAGGTVGGVRLEKPLKVRLKEKKIFANIAEQSALKKQRALALEKERFESDIKTGKLSGQLGNTLTFFMDYASTGLKQTSDPKSAISKLSFGKPVTAGPALGKLMDITYGSEQDIEEGKIPWRQVPFGDWNPELSVFEGDQIETSGSILKINLRGSRGGHQVLKMFKMTLPKRGSGYRSVRNQLAGTSTNLKVVERAIEMAAKAGEIRVSHNPETGKEDYNWNDTKNLRALRKFKAKADKEMNAKKMYRDMQSSFDLKMIEQSDWFQDSQGKFHVPYFLQEKFDAKYPGLREGKPGLPPVKPGVEPTKPIKDSLGIF